MLSQASRAGLAYSDFWDMTLGEFNSWQDGWLLREEDEWRRFRVMYALMYNINSTHHRTAEQLIPLASDTAHLKTVATAIPSLDARMAIASKYKGKDEVKISAHQFAEEFNL